MVLMSTSWGDALGSAMDESGVEAEASFFTPKIIGEIESLTAFVNGRTDVNGRTEENFKAATKDIIEMIDGKEKAELEDIKCRQLQTFFTASASFLKTFSKVNLKFLESIGPSFSILGACQSS